MVLRNLATQLLLFKVLFHGQIQLDGIRGVQVGLRYRLADGSASMTAFSSCSMMLYLSSLNNYIYNVSLL